MFIDLGDVGEFARDDKEARKEAEEAMPRPSGCVVNSPSVGC